MQSIRRNDFNGMFALLALVLLLTGVSVRAMTVTLMDSSDVKERSELFDVTLPPQNIVGGDVAPITDFPWQVVVYQRLNFANQPGRRLLRQIITAEDFSLTQICAGSIVGPKLIITTQSCVPPRGSEYEYWIASGVSDLTQVTPDYVNLRKVSRVVRYPRYFSPNYGRNIALLLLDQAIPFSSTQQAINLLQPNTRTRLENVGANVVISGWGAEVNRGPFSIVLRSAKVKIANDVRLRGQAGRLTKDQIAAGDFPGRGAKDSCDGDVGGSMTGIQNGQRVLVGITSWGVSCQSGIYPWVYNKASAYARWVERIESSNELPVQTMAINVKGRTYMSPGEMLSIPVIIPRNLKAVHFEMVGTGDVQLSVRFIVKIGNPDCVAGEDWRCSFYYPVEGIYTAVIKGMPLAGGYVRLDVVYEMFDNGGTTEQVTVLYSNNVLQKGEMNDWAAFPVIPNTVFSFSIVSKNPPMTPAMRAIARQQGRGKENTGPVLIGTVTSPRVTIGNAVSDSTPPLCVPDGDIGNAEDFIVTNCSRPVPRGATSMSIRIKGDDTYNTLYDLSVTYTRIKGASQTNVMTFPLVRLINRPERVIHIRNLKVGTEFGLRIHLFSGDTPLDASIFFGDRAQQVQANDKAEAGQTMFLSTIVPQYSQTAVLVFIGANCKFAFVALRD